MVMLFSSVLVRSSFLILLKKFRVLGEMVGVTGDGTNDDSVLKKVDVWFFEHSITCLLQVHYREGE